MSKPSKTIHPAYPKKEERSNPRQDTLKIPGCFMLPETGAILYCQIINLSNEGVGIYSQTFLQPKSTITWVTLEKVISFEVVWCLNKSPESSDDPFKYQCGLNALDDTAMLEELFGFIQHRE